MTRRTLTALTLSLGLAGSAVAPALADGAASTRNLLLGGAAAALLIINHNKKVHQKYAEKDAEIASRQQAADNAEAAYESEHEAYVHEVAINQSLQHEVAVQHTLIVRMRRNVAQRSGWGPSVSMTQPMQSVRLASTSYGWGKL